MVNFATNGTTGLRSARFDVDLIDCEVEGEIPKSLNGAFYRLHADWLYPPANADEASIAADGYVSMFRFKNGRVDYKGRYVRTLRYQNQVKAGRQVYGYYRNPFTDDPSVRDIENPASRTTANTTPVILAGKLLATKEDGHPYEIDPNTLETLGQPAIAGWDSQTFTAHPKVDPLTGETFAYGYEATGLCSRDVFVYCIDRTGTITKRWQLQVPHTSMLHDMWLTSEHIVIPGGGLTTDMAWLTAGKPHWGWDSTKPSYYAVIPRDGGDKDIRIFYGPEKSVVHTANARTEGSKIVLDAPVADGNTWPWFKDIHGAAYSRPKTTIRQITIDLNSMGDRIAERELFDQNTSSFTRIDDRYLTRPYRHIYVQYADTSYDSGNQLGRTDGNCYGRFDLQAHSVRPYFPGKARALQEPSFVPNGATGAEGDGYIIGVGHNVEALTTELYLIDAPTMEQVARVTLPFRTASQVHGVWASAGELPLT